jgi:RNA polymerase sigma-70 factor, ECF subfamily
MTSRVDVASDTTHPTDRSAPGKPAERSGPGGPWGDLFLARRAAAGHADAWDRIIDQYGTRILGVALQFATDRSEAEDLCQDIFLRLFQNLGRYRGDVPLAGWALRLSRNLCIDHYRRRRLHRGTVPLSEEVARDVASADDPQSAAQRREELALVYRALAEMPEDHATALVLRDLQGWSYDEIVAFLELPLGTVKSRIHRARLDLSRRLEAVLAPLRAGELEVPLSC